MGSQVLTSNYSTGLSYRHMAGSSTFTYSTIGDYLTTMASQCPNQLAVISSHQGIRKTYHELSEEANVLSGGFSALGLQLGDRVAVWTRNSYEWTLVAFALAKAGIIMVSVCPAFRAPEVEFALQKVRCKAVFIQHDLEDHDYYSILCQIDPEISTSETPELKLQRLPNLKYVIYAGKDAKRGTISLDSLMKTNLIKIPTQGTTGKPKAASITHFSLLNNAIFTFERTRFQETMVMCMQLPLYHIFACIQFLGVLSLKGTVVLPSARFNPVATLKAVSAERCNYIVGVETMYICMLEKLKDTPFDVSCIKLIKLGGSKSRQVIMDSIEQNLGARVLIGYGSTETTGTVSTQEYHENMPDKINRPSCGKLQPHTEVKIVNSRGEVVPLMEKGEVLVRGFQLFHGYYDDEEKTNEAIDQNGWYHSGDIGRLDEEGKLYIDGRLKNMIIRGGENIYPTEIEDILKTHQAVRNVQVVGVPDIKMGEELCAVVILNTGQVVSSEELRDFCKYQIAHFKVPKNYLFVDSFPITPTGKIQKYKLNEMVRKRFGSEE